MEALGQDRHQPGGAGLPHRHQQLPPRPGSFYQLKKNGPAGKGVLGRATQHTTSQGEQGYLTSTSSFRRALAPTAN